MVLPGTDVLTCLAVHQFALCTGAQTPNTWEGTGHFFSFAPQAAHIIQLKVAQTKKTCLI